MVFVERHQQVINVWRLERLQMQAERLGHVGPGLVFQTEGPSRESDQNTHTIKATICPPMAYDVKTPCRSACTAAICREDIDKVKSL